MCDSKPSNKSLRFGSSLEHGQAHAEDHRRWSRRDFLSGLGALTAGAFFLGGTSVRAYGASPVLNQLSRMDGDRILVLIQLKGGNDGLNTIIPFNDDVYYNLRPGISIPKAEAAAFSVSNDLGVHPQLAGLRDRYNNGEMTIIQNVGYPDPTLSHFRSTDIWQTAVDQDVTSGTGWLGRYLDYAVPDFVEQPPVKPLAVQIGSGSAQLFNGPSANMGMQLFSNEFLQRLEDGELYNQNAVPPTKYGSEMSFVRSITNNSFRYAEAVSEASQAGENGVEYPGGEGKLGDNLATIARLIKGGLGAKIYHVALQGFDTHSQQLGSHASLMNTLAGNIDAFLADLAMFDSDTEVLTMTYSEFGRRAEQNGSGGTDHGEAAPLFLFGSGVSGGLIGGVPRLQNINNGNVPHEIDFRSVYGSILQDWFGVNDFYVRQSMLGFPFQKLNFIESPSPVDIDRGEQPAAFTLDQNYPNPFNPTTTIRYALSEASPVRLDVFDLQGRKVQTLVDQTAPAGSHEVRFDANRLPSGTYLYRLEAGGSVQTRKMVLLR